MQRLDIGRELLLEGIGDHLLSTHGALERQLHIGQQYIAARDDHADASPRGLSAGLRECRSLGRAQRLSLGASEHPDARGIGVV